MAPPFAQVPEAGQQTGETVMMTQEHLDILIALAKIAVADQVALAPRRRDPDFPGLEKAEAAITAAEKTTLPQPSA